MFSLSIWRCNDHQSYLQLYCFIRNPDLLGSSFSGSSSLSGKQQHELPVWLLCPYLPLSIWHQHWVLPYSWNRVLQNFPGTSLHSTLKVKGQQNKVIFPYAYKRTASSYLILLTGSQEDHIFLFSLEFFSISNCLYMLFKKMFDQNYMAWKYIQSTNKYVENLEM